MNAGAERALTSSAFELFGLPPAFSIDMDSLEKAYREIQARVHPDRFAAAGDAERRASLQWTTRVNEAYTTLKSPVQRGKHLLELNGIDVAFETNTAMPPEFLMQQMELREGLEAAVDKKSASDLDSLRTELRKSISALVTRIGEAIDRKKDLSRAAEEVRKLMFLERLDEEIDAAYDEVD
jgi:molecular chaperone HscB